MTLKSIVIALVLWMLVAPAKAITNDVMIICSEETLKGLSKSQIRQIFLGGALSHKYTAVSLPQGHQARVFFNTKVLGLTEQRVQSYWAQMKFTGKGVPPLEMENAETIIDYLLSRKNAVAYLPASAPIPEGLVVVWSSQI